MAASLCGGRGKWRKRIPSTLYSLSSQSRTFRSDAALEALSKANDENVPNLVLYNYPSFFSLFAHLFHSRSPASTSPSRLERCYLLDFVGPTGFAAELAKKDSVIAFNHRKHVISEVKENNEEGCGGGVTFLVDMDKSSSSAVYDYFNAKLADEVECEDVSLLDVEERERVETVLKYIEEGDLRLWRLPDIRAFNIGLAEWHSKLNCFTNLYMYEQGVRAHGNSELNDEVGKQRSVKSAAAGLRSIGAVIFMQRKNLKMCLRSLDTSTDTSEVAKAYGGGGTPSSSSFIIRMDEYN